MVNLQQCIDESGLIEGCEHSPAGEECWCRCVQRQWTLSWSSWAEAKACAAQPLPSSAHCHASLRTR